MLSIVFTVKAKHCTTKKTPSYELTEVVSKESTKPKPEKNINMDRKSFTYELQHMLLFTYCKIFKLEVFKLFQVNEKLRYIKCKLQFQSLPKRPFFT